MKLRHDWRYGRVLDGRLRVCMACDVRQLVGDPPVDQPDLSWQSAVAAPTKRASPMAEALRHSRYRVTTAEHFNTALDLLESADKPDVLVTDIVMPRSINGVALARMARLRHPKVAAVFITGYRMIELEQMTFGPVLRKPIEPAQLIAAIEAEHARRAGETSPSSPVPVAPPDAA